MTIRWKLEAEDDNFYLRGEGEGELEGRVDLILFVTKGELTDLMNTIGEVLTWPAR